MRRKKKKKKDVKEEAESKFEELILATILLPPYCLITPLANFELQVKLRMQTHCISTLRP